MSCQHEPYIPKGFGKDWSLGNWKGSDLKLKLCKKCNCVYWEGE